VSDSKALKLKPDHDESPNIIFFFFGGSLVYARWQFKFTTSPRAQ